MTSPWLFEEGDDDGDSQRFVWLALIKNAWRRGRDFVVLRAVLAAAIACAGCTFHHAIDATPPDAPASADAIAAADGAASDAASQVRTLHQTADDVVAPNASVACWADATSTSATTWYRAFALPDYASITGAFRVTSVTFAIDRANASKPVAVSIGAYGGAVGGSTIDLTQMTPLASVQVAAQRSGVQVVPIAAAIPAGGVFVVSVAAPDMTGSGYFVIGSTTSAEIRPGYWTAPSCGQSQPQTTAAAGATGDVIIYVQGETP